MHEKWLLLGYELLGQMEKERCFSRQLELF